MKKTENKFYVSITRDTQSSKFILEIGNEYDAFRVPQTLPQLIAGKNKIESIIEREKGRENDKR
jgi:hypothetical protein